MSKNEILLNEFTLIAWGKTFEFRKYQREVIIDILNYQALNPEGSYILSAPTGSGKSIIAMCVAGVLELKDNIGYILTSDLGLQSQYQEDFDNSNVNWKTVKGKSNYECHVNGQTADVGDCVITKIQPNKLSCYSTCDYFQTRIAAQNSNITLLNYSYWLMQMNYVLPKLPAGMAPFQHRDFIISDEAHKITEIVQSHFSPTITNYSTIKIEKLAQFITENKLGNPGLWSDIHAGLYKNLVGTDSTSKIYKILMEMETNLNEVIDEGKNVTRMINSKYGKKNIPKYIANGISGFEYLNDLYNKIKDFNRIIKNTSHDEIVKISNDIKELITLKTINEDHLMNLYFHSVSKFQLYMSATISGKDAFIEDMNIPGARYTHIPSTWSFDKSQIYVWSGHKMSYNTMEENTPWMVNKIEQVLEMHKGERGIIHAGSYKFTNDIYNRLKTKYKNRVMIYKGSSEKSEMLEYLKYNDDTVIMGPSIIEGINLYDDLSRFQIIAKVPFPSLADKFTKRKMNIKRNWYSWKTVNSIIQGIGRSIRSETDYAKTYILDGNFTGLYFKNQDMFPIEFKKRVKIVK